MSNNNKALIIAGAVAGTAIVAFALYKLFGNSESAEVEDPALK